MKKTLARFGATLVAFTPALALAQFGEVDTFIGKITTFINTTLIPLVFTIALLMFIWGMYTAFIQPGGDREEGKKLAMWAVAGFVLMVSIWGIVNVLAGGLGFSGQPLNSIPAAPTR